MTRRAYVVAALLGVAGCATAPSAAASSGPYSRVGAFEPGKPEFEHTAATPAAPTNTVPTWDGVVMHPQRGLPMVRYGGRLYSNPVTVALFGLQEYNLYLYGRRPARLAGARRAADWLVRNQAADGAWQYRMPFTYPRDDAPLAVPWVAAQGQGNALSLLVRVWRATGHPRYGAAARRALGPFERPVGRRGLRRKVGRRVLYEGFPTRTLSVPLEDLQLALLGLYDLAPYSPRAAQLLQTGLAGLDWSLSRYTDEDGRALLDLRHHGGNTWKAHDPGAHRFNAHLLAKLAHVTRRPRLARYATLWIATIPPPDPDEALPSETGHVLGGDGMPEPALTDAPDDQPPGEG